MADTSAELTYYNLKLAKKDALKIKPRDVFADITNKNAAHIHVMCDHTFASTGYDIGETDKIYKEQAGVSALPYHFVIKHIESIIEVKNGDETGILTLEPGTVFLTRDTSQKNECNNSAMIGGADAITICLTLPAGSWLTQGYNEDTAQNLNLLLRYLMGELGLSIDHIHNLKNEYIGDYPVNPDSWKSFITQLKESMRQSAEKFAVSEEDGITVITIPESLGSNSNLNYIAKYCCPNASKAKLANFKAALAEVNDELWPNYSAATDEEKAKLDEKYIAFGTKVYLPGSISDEVVENLKAQEIYTEAKNNEVVANAVTVIKQSDAERELAEWNDPANVHHTGDDNIYLQNRGGKSEMKWRYQQMELPGYHNALLHFTKRNSDEEPVMINFLISPSSVQENRSPMVNNVKTLGGWVGTRAGSSMISVRFSGYMLDIYEQLERHRFLRDYKTYMESQKDSSHSYYNEYNCKLIIEGRDYYGYVSGLSFSKDAERPYIYQYNVTFSAYTDKEIYDPEWALVPWYKTERNKGNTSTSTAVNNITDDNIYNNLLQLVEEGWAGNTDTAAYKYLKDIINGATMSSIEEVRATTQEWLNILNYIRSKSNSWSYYLRQFIDSSIISNLDIWGYENSEPDMPSTIALFDKVSSGGTISSTNSDSSKHWSQPNAVSLYLKGVIKDKDSWFDSEWNITYADELTSRAIFLALCDNIGGSSDICLVGQYAATESDIIKKLEDLSGMSDLEWHWSYKHVWSLWKKDVISVPMDSYWLEDPEATITSEYAIPLIGKSRESANARIFPEFAATNLSTSTDEIRTGEAVIFIANKTTGGALWKSEEATRFGDAYIKHLLSLRGQLIIREWPDKDKPGVNETWAYYDDSDILGSSFNINSYLSRALALGLFDNIGGTNDGMLEEVADLSDEEVMSKLNGNFAENFEITANNYHPSCKNLLSLYLKGVFGDKISSYWAEDPESTVQSDYFYTIYQAASDRF